MLRTKNLISELKDVPRAWVFEHYLKLNEILTGQDLRIKSPFNPGDKTPSTYIFWSKASGAYKFKCFSTGRGGDGVTLLMQLLNMKTRGEAAFKIMSDYNEFLLNNKEDFSLREFKIQQKYKVIDYKIRTWTNIDQKYWTPYHIGSALLDKFKILPLDSYLMTKEINGELQQLEIAGRNCIYGYFRADGTLYKIYQPLVKLNKFIKIKDYIQGTDQLTYSTPYLVINSSLKDVVGFTKLGYKEVETVAPDSENTLIPENVITSYKARYKGICTLFDNDEAGIKAMKKYQELYGLKGILLPLSKDLTDSMKDYPLLKVKQVLTPLLKQALK